MSHVNALSSLIIFTLFVGPFAIDAGLRHLAHRRAIRQRMRDLF